VAVKLNKNWLLLTGAIAIGAIAFFLSYSAINTRIKQLDEDANKGKVMSSVVVASRNLQPGEIINSSSVSLRKIPQEFINNSSVTGENFDTVDGQGLLLGVKAGEPILTSYTVTRGGAYFSGTLKPGRRALTIEVDEISSISGMLRAGDKIDILVTAKQPKQIGVIAGTEDLTFPLLSNLAVLATGQAQRGSGNATVTYTHITLDVTPDEANSIIAAKTGGKMTAVLRSPTDELPNTSLIKSMANVVPSPQVGEIKMVEYLVGGSGGSGSGTVTQLPVSPLPSAANRLNNNQANNNQTTLSPADVNTIKRVLNGTESTVPAPSPQKNAVTNR
jgi:pilus assembly protein CpaB